MAILVLSILLLAMTEGSSGATWCVCRQDLSDSALQKTLDYACGAGADCSPILQNGPCFQPNTVKAHCSYAANSYFQKKGQAQGSCDFSGTATVTTTDPSTGGTCTYPSSGSAAGTTPGTGTTPNTSPPGTATTTAPPSTFTPNNPTGGVLGGGGITSTGLGPTGTGLGTDSSVAFLAKADPGLLLLAALLSIFLARV